MKNVISNRDPKKMYTKFFLCRVVDDLANRVYIQKCGDIIIVRNKKWLSQNVTDILRTLCINVALNIK